MPIGRSGGRRCDEDGKSVVRSESDSGKVHAPANARERLSPWAIRRLSEAANEKVISRRSFNFDFTIPRRFSCLVTFARGFYDVYLSREMFTSSRTVHKIARYAIMRRWTKQQIHTNMEYHIFHRLERDVLLRQISLFILLKWFYYTSKYSDLAYAKSIFLLLSPSFFRFTYYEDLLLTNIYVLC